MAIETLRPNGVGTYTEIESRTSGEHWENVDETPADDWTSIVYSNEEAPETDTYAIPNHSVGSGTINHVKVYMRCYAYTAPAWVTIYTHATLYYGDEENVPTTWTNYSKQWDNNPNTSNPWTWEEIDALEIGATLNPAGGDIYCTQVYVEVDYTAGAVYYHGLKVQGIGELALCDVGTHPLRIRKGGVTYGIELVDTSDPNASAVRVKTGAGIKAIRKYP